MNFTCDITPHDMTVSSVIEKNGYKPWWNSAQLEIYGAAAEPKEIRIGDQLIHDWPTAFVFGVIKKYGDDNGGVLVSNLAYSSFVSIFPLLLILYAILGLIAAADPSFREKCREGEERSGKPDPAAGPNAGQQRGYG